MTTKKNNHMQIGSNVLPLIMQSEAAECGVACLAMVTGYFGYKTDLTELRQKFVVSIEGCTLLDLMQFAERLHLTGRPLRLELEQLQQLALPAILHWDLNHFVVLKEVRKGHCVIHDPAFGYRKMTLSEVSDHFTGIALELRPTVDFSKKESTSRLRLADFWAQIHGLKRSLGLLLVLSVMLQLFTIASPYYLQLVVDDVLLTADTPLLLVLALGFGFVLIFETLTHWLRGFLLLHFGNSLNVQMAVNLFHHLIRLPMSYFEKRHIGDVLSRFSSLHQIKELLTTGVLESIIDGLMVVVVLAVMLVYSLQLSIIVVISMLIYTAVRLVMYAAYRQASEQQIQASAKESSHKIETLRAMQTLKLLSGEHRREAAWQHLQLESTNQDLRIGAFNISYQMANRLISGIENIIVVYLGALLVLDGGFSTGMLFAFLAYKTQFIDRASRLVEKLIQFRMLSLHMDRLADIVRTKKEVLQPEQQTQHQLAGGLEMQAVTYRYSDTSAPIIDGISLTIQPGESVALIGPSGCGKTTLMKIMLGLLDPQSGSVLLDGHPLPRIGLSQYRSQIAAVMQDDQLLSGTIRDNIAFFQQHVDMAWVETCARLAAIDPDIQRMPMGYNSLIGDMGAALSGGQKQRILLARALYQRPRILFLDEATSHLDGMTEHAVSAAIRQLNITRVVIAHRQETIATVDRVIDLSNKD